MQRTHGAGIASLPCVTRTMEFIGTFKAKNGTFLGKPEPLVNLLSAWKELKVYSMQELRKLKQEVEQEKH